MYKDVLQTLNNDRKVDRNFIKRLEKNGFEIELGKYDYWDNQEYIQIGTGRVWLVRTYPVEFGSGMYIDYRYRNEVVEDIKYTIEKQKELLNEENSLIDEMLPIK